MYPIPSVGRHSAVRLRNEKNERKSQQDLNNKNADLHLSIDKHSEGFCLLVNVKLYSIFLELCRLTQLNLKVFLPVASLTTAMSVGLPNPDRSRTAETIFLYKLSSSSRVLARLSVISLSTGCKRDSNTLLCSSKKSSINNKDNAYFLGIVHLFRNL